MKKILKVTPRNGDQWSSVVVANKFSDALRALLKMCMFLYNHPIGNLCDEFVMLKGYTAVDVQEVRRTIPLVKWWGFIEKHETRLEDYKKIILSNLLEFGKLFKKKYKIEEMISCQNYVVSSRSSTRIEMPDSLPLEIWALIYKYNEKKLYVIVERNTGSESWSHRRIMVVLANSPKDAITVLRDEDVNPIKDLWEIYGVWGFEKFYNLVQREYHIIEKKRNKTEVLTVH